MRADTDIAEIVDGVDSFIQKEIMPLEEKNAGLLHNPRELYNADTGAYTDAARQLIRDVKQRSARAGYYAIAAPESVGGGGAGYELFYAIWERIARTYGPAAVLPREVISHWSSGPSFLCDALSPTLKDRMLSGIVDGTLFGAFALSEPDAGSDAWAMSTKAVRDGEDWVINGTKQWITSSPIADYVYVFAVTDEEQRAARRGGISCFVVPTDTPGFAVDSVIRILGEVGGNEAILSFTDVRVPAENIVGVQDRGFSLAVQGVSLGRVYNSARCTGWSVWATQKSADYAQQRRAFGKTLSEHQGIAFTIPESAMEIYAAQAMAKDCVRRMDNGEDARTELAILKAYTTEMCFRVFDRTIQLHGGIGLTNETGFYEGWHISRTVRIADGSTEVMKRNILGDILKGRFRL